MPNTKSWGERFWFRHVIQSEKNMLEIDAKIGGTHSILLLVQMVAFDTMCRTNIKVYRELIIEYENFRVAPEYVIQ